ncbi:MAG: hypothetical protein ACLUYK_03030 [Eggerthella lenta]
MRAAWTSSRTRKPSTVPTAPSTKHSCGGGEVNIHAVHHRNRLPIRFTVTRRSGCQRADAFEQDALPPSTPTLTARRRVVDAGDGTRVFRHTEPLRDRVVLECHGDPVGELDQYGYPRRACRGTVGGAMSITEPMGIYAAGIQDSMMQQAIMVLFMMVAAFIGLYRDKLAGAAAHRRAAKCGGPVGKGDFNHPSRCPTPASGPATSWRSSPASRPHGLATLRLYADLEAGAFQDRRPWCSTTC